MESKTVIIILLSLLLLLSCGLYFGYNYTLDKGLSEGYTQGYNAGAYQAVDRQTMQGIYFYTYNGTIQTITLNDLCGVKK